MNRITKGWLVGRGFRPLVRPPGVLSQWRLDLPAVTFLGQSFTTSLVVIDGPGGGYSHPRILQTEGAGSVDTVYLPGKLLGECDRAAMESLLIALGVVSVSDRG